MGVGLAKEGCRVAINGRDPDKLEAAAATMSAESEGQVIGLRGRCQRSSVPARWLMPPSSALGGLDLLVTNAGGPPAGSFESFDEADVAEGP